MSAEAPAAAPIVIGAIQGAKFIYHKIRARRPEARLLKWEKRVGEAMSIVAEHQDYVLQAAMEKFTSKCHMWKEHRTLLAFTLKTTNMSRKDILELTQRLSEGCKEIVNMALNMSTNAMERTFICDIHHADHRRRGKCNICMREEGQVMADPTTAPIPQVGGTVHDSSSPAIHYHIHIHHDQHAMAPDERMLTIVLPPTIPSTAGSVVTQSPTSSPL